jgi:hypothetical protein
MKRLGIVAVVVALVAAVVVCSTSPAGAQPVASITLPSPGAMKQLYPGCNNIGLTFENGTASQTVVQAITPTGAVQAMWRHNAALNRFEGFSPAAAQASDLLTVNLWDAVWLCVGGTPPTAPTVPPVPPTAAHTATPQPTATPVQQALNAEQYWSAVQSVDDRLITALGTFASLLDYPLSGDPAWRQAIGDQLDVFRSSYATAIGLVPPPEFTAFHTEWVTALSLLAQAADVTEVGIDNQDPEALARASSLIHEGTAHMTLATALLPEGYP